MLRLSAQIISLTKESRCYQGSVWGAAALQQHRNAAPTRAKEYSRCSTGIPRRTPCRGVCEVAAEFFETMSAAARLLTAPRRRSGVCQLLGIVLAMDSTHAFHVPGHVHICMSALAQLANTMCMDLLAWVQRPASSCSTSRQAASMLVAVACTSVHQPCTRTSGMPLVFHQGQ